MCSPLRITSNRTLNLCGAQFQIVKWPCRDQGHPRVPPVAVKSRQVAPHQAFEALLWFSLSFPWGWWLSNKTHRTQTTMLLNQ